MRHWLCILLLFILGLARAQDATLDSLKSALKSALHDSSRCRVLSALAEVAPDGEWEKYNEQLRTLAEKNSKEKGSLQVFYLAHLAEALNNLGVSNNNRGNINEAIEYYQKSLVLYTTAGDKYGIATVQNNIGYIYQNQGDIPAALDHLEKSLKIREELGDKMSIANSLNNIGLVHYHQGDLAAAIQYGEKSLATYLEAGDSSGIAYALNNLGICYLKKGDTVMALLNYQKSLKIRDAINDVQGMTYSLISIGDIHKKQGRLNEALEYLKRSLQLGEASGDKFLQAPSLGYIAGTYLAQNKLSDALHYGKLSLAISRELGFPEHIKNAADLLSRIYQQKGQYKEALENLELYITMRDSIANNENKKAAIKAQLKYAFEKKAAADSVRVAEEKKVSQAKLKQERTKRYALYGGLGLLAVFASFMVNRFRVVRKQKKIIEAQKQLVEEQKEVVEEKQKEILDSIHYARRIQRALITPEGYIAKSLLRLRGPV